MQNSYFNIFEGLKYFGQVHITTPMTIKINVLHSVLELVLRNSLIVCYLLMVKRAWPQESLKPLGRLRKVYSLNSEQVSIELNGKLFRVQGMDSIRKNCHYVCELSVSI